MEKKVKGKKQKTFIGQKTKTEDVVQVLLQNRGIKTKNSRKMFFNPPDPRKFSAGELGIDNNQLKKAASRIKQAIKNKEKIIIYGDYDVDGICATAILWETLFALGANVLPYIPSRFTEGYGLNEESIKKLKNDDPNLGLIITVDHGIVAHEKVDFVNALGLDIIITDHHEPGKTKPDAYAIVHTTRISGSAVAWILAKAIKQKAKSPPTPRLRWAGKKQNDGHLGLVTLGTVADILPLVGYNRSIVVYGLEELRKTQRPGIKALCEEASIKQEEISTYHIGFIIGPRLNAAGRVEHAIDSLRLLCVKKTPAAKELAAKLGKINKVRQEKTEIAVGHIEKNFTAVWKDGNTPKLIFVHHESYEEGVIGVVAGKLVEKYARPAIVMSQGKEFSKGSARSVSRVNIVELIREAGGELFVGVGGHRMAAGFTIKTEHLEDLKRRLFFLSEKEIKEDDLVRNIRVDCDLELSCATEELYREIRKFAPFGFGNPEPTFRTKQVCVKEARVVGKGDKHLKLVLERKGLFEAIGFGMGEWYTRLSPDKPVDIVYSITVDAWNGNYKLQLKLKDIQLHG